jgi:outer membrane protein OmpA-like peptidoglycan-associated protein
MGSPTNVNKLPNVKVTANPGVSAGIMGELFNFAINSSALRPEHKEWLDKFAIPLLKNGTMRRVSLFGHGSRSGSDDVNKRLSQQRAFAVWDYLVRNGVSTSQIDQTLGLGEAEAARAGDADGSEDARFRAVHVLLQN